MSITSWADEHEAGARKWIAMSELGADSMAAAVRSARAQGATIATIAEQFGRTPRTVYRMLHAE